MAPEMVSQNRYGRKVDVYSFRLILYEMVSRWVPFSNLSPFQVAYGVANQHLQPEVSKECPKFKQVLIELCCYKYPEMRPKFSGIVKFLEGVGMGFYSGGGGGFTGRVKGGFVRVMPGIGGCGHHGLRWDVDGARVGQGLVGLWAGWAEVMAGWLGGVGRG
ncbi:Serine/threonine-protein kinase HT1 [Bienertia sinuspersici]